MPVKRKTKAKAAAKPIKLRKPRAAKNSVQLLLQLLSALYPNMPLSPGVVFSYLTKEKMWYGAVYIYPTPDKNQRVCLTRTKALSYDTMVANLCRPWTTGESTARDLTNRLRRNYGGLSVEMEAGW